MLASKGWPFMPVLIPGGVRGVDDEDPSANYPADKNVTYQQQQKRQRIASRCFSVVAHVCGNDRRAVPGPSRNERLPLCRRRCPNTKGPSNKSRGPILPVSTSGELPLAPFFLCNLLLGCGLFGRLLRFGRLFRGFFRGFFRHLLGRGFFGGCLRSRLFRRLFLALFVGFFFHHEDFFFFL